MAEKFDFKKEALPLKIEPYQEAARTAPIEQFVQQVPYPVLLFARSKLWDPLLLVTRSQEGATRGTQMVSYEITGGGPSFISPVTKRQTDPNDDGIWLGRDTTNDMVVPISSVSGRHLIFRRVGGAGRWTVTDLSTKNGTWVGEEKAQPNQPMAVADGDYLRLGGNLIAWFLQAARLHMVFNTPGELARLIDT
jgi:hypothetical protein